MQLCSVEHKLNTSSTFFFIKIRFSLSNVLIKGESKFDGKKCQRSVQLVFNLCSTCGQLVFNLRSTCVQLDRGAYILGLLATELVL